MAEQEKNYLDIEATAAQVKKGIEEVVDVLTTDVLENNNKVFTLEVAEELNEESSEEDLLNGVKIRLEKLAAQNIEYINTISGLSAKNVQAAIDELNGTRQIRVAEYEIPVGNGNNWVYGTGASAMYVNSRIGGYADSDNPSSGRIFAIGPKVTNTKEDHHVIMLTDGINVTNPVDLSGYSVFQIGEKSQCAIRQNSDVKIGRVGTQSTSPTRIHIFDGAEVDIDGGTNGGNSGHPQIYIHENASIQMDGSVENSRISIETPNNKTAGTRLVMHDGAVLAMSEESVFLSSGQMFTALNDGLLYFNKAEAEPYSPVIAMNGGGTIIFNSDEYADESGITKDPLLLANPSSLIYQGKASTHTTENTPVFDITRSFRSWYDDSVIPENRNPRFNIGDETIITIDGDCGTGSNWIKIGANSGGQNVINITDNAFFEQGGSSIFCMRGFSSGSDVSTNIITRSGEKNYTGSQKSGAIFDMEGSPVFVMRSKPPMGANDYDYRYNECEYISGMETLEGMSSGETSLGSPFFGMETGAKVLLQNGSKLDLNNGSSISMNDGAELKLSQGGSITIDGENITFKINGDSETFTMNELHQLKTLLTNSTIS